MKIDYHGYEPVTRTFDAPPPVFCLFTACEISVVAIRASLDLERHKAILTPFCMTLIGRSALCHQQKYMQSKVCVQCPARNVYRYYANAVQVSVTNYSKERRAPKSTPMRLTNTAFRCK